MKQLLLVGQSALTICGTGRAILQIDIPAENIPAGCLVTATLRMCGMPPAMPATMVAGPDGFPLAYHLIFNYDELIPPGPVCEICVTVGSCTQCWTLAPFTLFYNLGPAFPVVWLIDPFDPACCAIVGAAETESAFQLRDAAPNPFNPVTTIHYSLARAEYTRLTVHNLVGQVVAVLVDGLRERGEHAATFDAGGLASGVYAYTLEAGGRRQTRTLSLVE